MRREEREREGEKTSGCLQQLIELTTPIIIIIIIIIIILKCLILGKWRLGDLSPWLNVPTQGERVAQIGDERPFSLMAPGSVIPSWESNPGRIGD